MQTVQTVEPVETMRTGSSVCCGFVSILPMGNGFSRNAERSEDEESVRNVQSEHVHTKIGLRT